MALSALRRALGGGLLAALSAAAQPPAAITLDQAVSEALHNNAALLAERANIGIAESRILAARLRPNPVLSAGADHLPAGRFTEANGGGPTEMNLRVDLPMERAAKRPLRLEVARAGHSIATLEYRNAARSLVLDVRTAFVDAQAARDALVLARQSLANLNRVVEINAIRYRAGDLSKVESIRSRLAALQTENAVRQAELRLSLALTRLANLIGRADPATLTTALGDLPTATPPLALDPLLADSLRLRPDLEAVRRDLARARADLRLQTALAHPDYTVGTEYRRQQGVNGTSNSVGVFFEIPLALRDRNQGEIARAGQEIRQVEARLRAQEAAVTAEVHTAARQYETARSMLDRMQGTLLEEARQVREITEYSYRRGEASLLEMLDAERAFNETTQAYNDARAEFARALYQLDAVSGKEVNP